ncbi:Bacterial lipocalin [Gulbenkiania indica]|uniref:Bacterial lipocalin n=2 Tax=Gulbenkiania TaxID=397456 RepID=A0A0K6GTY9_9NEIS|nr:lipocalin family protein [Gulbenkiania indica]TCW33825.1 lipocalin [Gulbenkiania mobilis]CUA82196.1 Bacterial lipocalin [Gulbenkiania indica]
MKFPDLDQLNDQIRASEARIVALDERLTLETASLRSRFRLRIARQLRIVGGMAAGVTLLQLFLKSRARYRAERRHAAGPLEALVYSLAPVLTSSLGKHMTALLLAFGAPAAANAAAQLETVSHVDLERYAGEWYELARFPMRFERKCDRNVTAHYLPLPDGGLQVLNSCRRADGRREEATGYAYVADGATNAKLKVTFVPDWLHWVPFVWADYWIIDLADDYSTAVVATPKRDYLWLLSRTPEVAPEVYQRMVNAAEMKGFDVSRLIRTPQIHSRPDPAQSPAAAAAGAEVAAAQPG